jgi:hypothetical protein
MDVGRDFPQFKQERGFERLCLQVGGEPIGIILNAVRQLATGDRATRHRSAPLLKTPGLN